MDVKQQLRERLATVPLFAECPPSHLRVVGDRAEIREVAVGTELIRRGDEGDEFFVLLAGEAEVRRNDDRAATLQSGDHFGELALLDPAPRSADVVMTTDGTVGVLNRAQFLLVLDAVPATAHSLLSFLARRLRAAEAGAPSERL